MNALVTGAGGWLGRCLVGKLIAKGHTVICIDLWPAQHPTPVLRSRKKNIRIVKGDIRRPERFIKEMRGCDAVFNCAGSQHPRWTSELYEINSLAQRYRMAPAELKKELEEKKELDTLRHEIRMGKILDFILANAGPEEKGIMSRLFNA